MRKNNFDPDAMAKAGRERAALELDDLFQLRNIELPCDQVREEQRGLVKEMRKIGSDNSGVVQAVADLLNELDGLKHSLRPTAMI
jgi:hypothetical protein